MPKFRDVGEISSWAAKRAGGAITVNGIACVEQFGHAVQKPVRIVGVTEIFVTAGRVFAVRVPTNERWELVL